MTTTQQLRTDILEFVLKRTETIIQRFLPGITVPGYIAGYRTAPWDTADLLYVLIHLRHLGVDTIAGEPIRDAMVKLLRRIDGAATETFYSYRVAEALMELGGLDDFTPAERANLITAVDSTHIYDPATQSLNWYAANYWAVLARCEFSRQKLGLLEDTTLLERCLEKTREHLFENPHGYFDDSGQGMGRYDIYSADMYIFTLPYWHLLDAEKLDHNLRQHVAWLETMALENGAFNAWGRSSGALSVVMTIELGSIALRHGLAANPARVLGLMENAFGAFQGWIQDDLISAHRGRMTEGYRGVPRLLQMTLDCFSKLLYAASVLGEAPEPVGEPGELFPPRDTLIHLDDQNAALWMFRNRNFAFHLPLLGGLNADYVAWLHSPGLFENPVESALVCGVPRFFYQGANLFSVGRPCALEKRADGLSAKFNQVHGKAAKADAPLPEISATRAVDLRVEDDTIVATEHWTFSELPDAIGFDIPETARQLRLEVESACEHTLSTVVVEGMAEWRGCWGAMTRVHHVDFTPAREITFTWRLRPKLRVTFEPIASDYNRQLYAAMPPDTLEVRSLQQDQFPEFDINKLVGNSDIFHVGWPEHMIREHGLPIEEFDRRYLKFIEELGASPVKVVLTAHNRRPHSSVWRGERGDNLYNAWARIADGVIHHSEVGMATMRAEMPYKKEALHTVIKHGHFGEMMPRPGTREELEARHSVPPTAIRYGVLGRAQKEKQVDFIARAFMRTTRPDIQLMITAHPIETDVSGDPRIILLPKEHWVSREEVTGHVYLCDALVSAHRGESFLTSGSIADAIGVGIPMLVNQWPFFREMLGENAWYHEDTEESLARLFQELTVEDIAAGKERFTALQAPFAWPGLARETAEFFRAVGFRR